VAQKQGWWKPADSALDWLKAVSHGEYNHPYYSLRRVWRLQQRLCPSVKLSPWVEDGYTRAYPFSVKPEKKLAVADVMALHRDHYEGTEFDLTRGLAAGPYGDPNRYVGHYDGNQNNVSSAGFVAFGAWERPISVFYSGFIYINQARAWLPDPVGGVSWIGYDKPAESCLVPFYVGVTNLPKAYQVGSTMVFDRSFAWWAFNFVANWAELKYSYMIKDIQALQAEIESKQYAMQPAIEKAAQELVPKNPALAREFLTRYCTDNANQVLEQWWVLGDRLIAKYSDGYVNAPEKMSQEVGYPKEWLLKVGYEKGPLKYAKPVP